MVGVELLAALDGLIWLRTGHQVASRFNIRAPRIISKSQRFCRHEEAAKEAGEKETPISNIDKIA